jgi:hypothetical protein
VTLGKTAKVSLGLEVVQVFPGTPRSDALILLGDDETDVYDAVVFPMTKAVVGQELARKDVMLVAPVRASYGSFQRH